MIYFTKKANMTPEREQQIRNTLDASALAQGWTEEYKQKELKRYIYTQRNTINYQKDSRGQLTIANNPFLNGTLVEGRDYGYYASGTPSAYEDIDLTKTGVQKSKDSGWTPTASATVNFNSNSRMYLRYSEAYRMPSMFESTLGFSGTLSGYKLEPEHASNYELAYVYNLSEFLKTAVMPILNWLITITKPRMRLSVVQLWHLVMSIVSLQKDWNYKVALTMDVSLRI